MARVISPAESNLRERLQKRWNKAKLFWFSNNPEGNAGIPDTAGVHRGVSWWVEFKAEDGVLATHQLDWLTTIARNQGLALEVRANTKNPWPWGAEYRIATNGQLSNPFMIDRDDWLEWLVEGVLLARNEAHHGSR